jgi:tetratricopeptide (TPR) repeat protein
MEARELAMNKTSGLGLVRVVLVAALMVVAAVSSAEAAGGKAEAKRHYRKGVTEYNLGHFENAIAEFDQAYSLDPSPILLYNIAQAHRKLGDNRQALFFFRRYLDEDPRTKDRAQVEQSIHELEEASRTSAVAPPPAAAAPPPPPTPVVTPTPEPAPAPVIIEQIDQPAARAEPASWQRPAAWVAAGLAVGAAGLGIQQNLAYASHRRDFNAMEACAEMLPGHGSPACDRLLRDAHSAKTLSLIGYIGGGVLAAVSVGLFYYGYGAGANEAPRTASRTNCRLLGPAGSCTFVF